MLRILLVMFIVIGCKIARTEGDAKFITVAQDDPDRFVNGKNILIKRVHEESWNIFYRFHNNCPDNRKTEKDHQTVRQKLEEGIRIWLEPLRKITSKPIVDKFIFYESKETDLYRAKNNQQVKHEIAATFVCKAGRSSADRYERGISMREKANGKNSPTFGNLPYNISTLLHELGHAFDLADTYVGNLDFSPPSSGTYLRTIGNQPKSIMSGGYCSRQGGLCLDDKRAIQWLYRYHYEGLDPTDCPPEFVYEELTHDNKTVGGCVYRQPLIIELRQRHIDRMKSLLANDTNLKINDKDKHGYAALHYVAPLHLDHGKYIRWILVKILEYPNIDVNITDNHNNTPLHWAAWFGNDYMVWELLFLAEVNGVYPESKTIKLNAQNRDGATSLHYAAKHGCKICVEIFVMHSGLKPNIKEHRSGNTPLHEAAKNGHTEVVKMLLAHEGINRNIRNRGNKTARQLAELNGHEETMKAFD